MNVKFDVSLDLPPSSTAIAPARVASCPPAERVDSGYRHKGAAPRDSELEGASHLPGVSDGIRPLVWTMDPSTRPWPQLATRAKPTAGLMRSQEQLLNAEGVMNIRRELAARRPDDQNARQQLKEAAARLA